jgi:hypothetical protein
MFVFYKHIILHNVDQNNFNMQEPTYSEKQEEKDTSIRFEECSHKYSQNGTSSCIKCGKRC